MKKLLLLMLVLLYILVKGVFSEEDVSTSIMGLILYIALLYLFVIPILTKEDIRIPVYGNILVKNKDEALRGIIFLVSSALCVSILIGFK